MISHSERIGLVKLRRAPACLAAALFLAAAPGAVTAFSALDLVPNGPLPDPCAAVPTALIAAAYGATEAPAGKLSVVRNTSTCSYARKGTILTLFVGYTSVGPPGTAKKAVAVPGLPHGLYITFTTTTQTEVSFYKGPAATGVYGIVRTTGKISKSYLVSIALALNQSIPAPA